MASSKRQTGEPGSSRLETGSESSTKPGGRCPICTAPTDAAFRPFCSSRCADVDLSRWLRGGYAIAGRADVDEDGDDTIAANNARQPDRSDDDDD